MILVHDFCSKSSRSSLSKRTQTSIHLSANLERDATSVVRSPTICKFRFHKRRKSCFWISTHYYKSVLAFCFNSIPAEEESLSLYGAFHLGGWRNATLRSHLHTHSQRREMRRICIEFSSIALTHSHAASVWLHFGRCTQIGVRCRLHFFSLSAVWSISRSVACTLGLAVDNPIDVLLLYNILRYIYLSAVAFPWAEQVMQRGEPAWLHTTDFIFCGFLLDIEGVNILRWRKGHFWWRCQSTLQKSRRTIYQHISNCLHDNLIVFNHSQF